MNEISTFGILVLTVAAGVAALLAWSQITARLPIPGAAFFLVGAGLASNLVWGTREVLSIRSVERITVVALIVILFDGGMNVGWHRFRTALPAIGLLGIVGTAGTAGLLAIFAHYLFGFRWILAGILGAALAPTDPAVMFSVLRGRQIGGRASIALEGEAGINDAVAIAIVVGLVEYVCVAPYGYSHHFEHHFAPNVPYYRLAWAHGYLKARGISLRSHEYNGAGYLPTFIRVMRELGARSRPHR